MPVATTFPPKTKGKQNSFQLKELIFKAKRVSSHHGELQDCSVWRDLTSRMTDQQKCSSRVTQLCDVIKGKKGALKGNITKQL